jgi:polyketide biosynthesis enoyl-CoA hydratase PksH
MTRGGEYETLRVEEQQEVLRVVLDRPERQNSINDVLLSELHAVLDRAERSAGLRIVALEGAGPVFCSGMDFVASSSSIHGRDGLAARGGAAFFDLLRRFTTSARVIVACVDGRVIGGGVGLVAACDFVYATERSSFGLPEALWGLLPCCVLPFLIRRVGFQPAYAMTLSTLPVSARQAERISLVDEVVDDARPSLRRLGARLTKIDDVTIADGKRYFERVGFSVAQLEDPAIGEFSRLMASPVIQTRIANFASHRQMPWEVV